MCTPDRPKHVLSVFSTFAVGGPQRRFAALANHFGPALRHSIVAMDGKLAARDFLNPALDIAFPDAGFGAANSAFRLTRMAGFLRHLAPDLMVTSNWGAIEWAVGHLMTGIRHLHMEDGFGPEEQTRQLRRRVIARRVVLRGSDTIVPSRTLETIARTIWRLPLARLHYVPNGIDLARFRNAAPAPLPAGDGKVIGTIAALRAEKNLGRLIRAFGLVRRRMPARLVIVGDGPQRAELAQLAADQGVADSCFFAGHTDTPDAWLAAFDVFALSSDTEQMPLSVLEAAASALPVAATDVGDVRAMLALENAAFVVSLDDAALAEAMASLLSHPRARDIGQQNRRKAEAEYGQDTMFAAYAALLGIGSNVYQV